MIKALVVGLGMGQQYTAWFKSLGYTVSTVDSDPEKFANYLLLSDALTDCNFDIAYIGTPNYTHELLARQVAVRTKILLIEKPGVESQAAWIRFVNDFPETRIMMIKNNQYRLEHSGWRALADNSKKVTVCWSRQNGVPKPNWFKDKQLSFGGVKSDLMPHMLSYYTLLTDYKYGQKIYQDSDDMVNIGIDSRAFLEFKNKDTTWNLIVDWKNNCKDENYIEFETKLGVFKFDLGELCPADPYIRMIKTAMNNIDNKEFWLDQYDQDVWIHKQLETL